MFPLLFTEKEQLRSECMLALIAQATKEIVHFLKQGDPGQNYSWATVKMSFLNAYSLP